MEGRKDRKRKSKGGNKSGKVREREGGQDRRKVMRTEEKGKKMWESGREDESLYGDKKKKGNVRRGGGED